MYKAGIVEDYEKSRSGKVVDLRSDTVTQPSREMKEAMMAAPLGDDVFRDDPTANLLEEKMAALSGKEAALFVPSGSMGNLISIMSHCWTRGAEIIIGDKSHINLYEQGSSAQVAAVHPRALANLPDGTFSIQEMKLKVREEDCHHPITSLVAIENSHNKCGGRALPRDWINELTASCRTLNLPVHCDGARVFNSAVSQGLELSDMLQGIDSASICFSKGLGCPVGSVIVGSKPFIERAIRVRKCLGGGMRQVGILAAACLYSLDHMVDRLAEDHTHARLLAETINEAGKGRFFVDLKSVDTNIVLMTVDLQLTTPEKVCELLNIGEVKVLALPFSHNQVRFVFHCMIDDEQAQLACLKVTEVLMNIINN